MEVLQEFATPSTNPTEPDQIGVAASYFLLDGRELPAAAVDSCGDVEPLCRQFLERPFVALEHGLLSTELLPSADDDVAVLRLQFNQPRLAPGLLARDERRAGTAEGIKHSVAALAAVPDGALNQFD